MNIKDIYAQVAADMNLSPSYVKKVYRGYWKAIREHISSFDLKQDISEEEFKKMKPQINIPSIGKLYVDYDNCKKIRDYYKSKIENATHKED